MSEAGDPDGTQAPITRLLQRWGAGEGAALEELMERVYGDLQAIARQRLRRGGATLDPTALVGELYVRLLGQRKLDFRNREQFFALSSLLMRRLLADHARRRRARGADLQVTLPAELGAPAAGGTPVDALALHQALERLAAEHPREHRVVELRCFGGLGVEEVARILGVATGTIKRDWRFARNWLYAELKAGSA